MFPNWTTQQTLQAERIRDLKSRKNKKGHRLFGLSSRRLQKHIKFIFRQLGGNNRHVDLAQNVRCKTEIEKPRTTA